MSSNECLRAQSCDFRLSLSHRSHPKKEEEGREREAVKEVLEEGILPEFAGFNITIDN